MPFTPTTETILTQSVYPAGEQPGNLIPWPAGATSCTATALLSDADVKDATKSVTVTLTESFDQGQTLQRGPSALCSCGVLGRDGVTYILPAVAVGYGTSQNFPSHVSGIIGLSSPLSVGLKLQFS